MIFPHLPSGANATRAWLASNRIGIHHVISPCQPLPSLDEKRQEMVGRNRGIRAKEGEPIGTLLAAYTRKAEERDLGKLIVEVAILLSARTQSDGGKVLRAAGPDL